MTAFDWLEQGARVGLMMPTLERDFEYELRDLLHIGRSDFKHELSKAAMTWRAPSGRMVRLRLLRADRPDRIRGLGLDRAWTHPSTIRHDSEALRNLRICCHHGDKVATSRGLSTPVRMPDFPSIFRFQKAAQQLSSKWELLASGGKRHGR
jgi:hypothetical protein